MTLARHGPAQYYQPLLVSSDMVGLVWNLRVRGVVGSLDTLLSPERSGTFWYLVPPGTARRGYAGAGSCGFDGLTSS
jgi:hypothetical protein